MPAERHSATAAGTLSADRVGKPDQPVEREVEVVRCGQARSRRTTRAPRPARAGPRAPWRPLAVHPRGAAAPMWHRSAIASGAPLAAMTRRSPPDAAPDVRHGQQFGAQRILALQLPARAVQVLGAGQCAASSWNAFSIGSNGSRALARMPKSSQFAWNRFGQRNLRRRSADESSPSGSRRAGRSPSGSRVSVPVLSVHSTVAAPSVSMAAARASARGARHAPRAHRHEHREDDRKLLGQHRHGQRDARQHRLAASRRAGAVETPTRGTLTAAPTTAKIRTSRRVCASAAACGSALELAQCRCRSCRSRCAARLRDLGEPVPRTTSEPE